MSKCKAFAKSIPVDCALKSLFWLFVSRSWIVSQFMQKLSSFIFISNNFELIILTSFWLWWVRWLFSDGFVPTLMQLQCICFCNCPIVLHLVQFFSDSSFSFWHFVLITGRQWRRWLGHATQEGAPCLRLLPHWVSAWIQHCLQPPVWLHAGRTACHPTFRHQTVLRSHGLQWSRLQHPPTHQPSTHVMSLLISGGGKNDVSCLTNHQGVLHWQWLGAHGGAQHQEVNWSETIQFWVHKSKIGSTLENSPSDVALAMAGGAWGCSTAGRLTVMVRDNSILGSQIQDWANAWEFTQSCFIGNGWGHPGGAQQQKVAQKSNKHVTTIKHLHKITAAYHTSQWCPEDVLLWMSQHELSLRTKQQQSTQLTRQFFTQNHRSSQ